VVWKVRPDAETAPVGVGVSVSATNSSVSVDSHVRGNPTLAVAPLGRFTPESSGSAPILPGFVAQPFSRRWREA